MLLHLLFWLECMFEGSKTHFTLDALQFSNNQCAPAKHGCATPHLLHVGLCRAVPCCAVLT
jgi:hypothetical protein